MGRFEYLDRDAALQMLTGRRHGSYIRSYALPADIREVREPHDSELVGVWADHQPDYDLPSSLVCGATILEDLLAWVLTYRPTNGPLSAFVRFASWAEFQDTLATAPPTSSFLRGAVAGCVLGEALVLASLRHSRSLSKQLDMLRLVSGTSTSGFVTASLLLQGRSRTGSGPIDAWHNVRAILHGGSPGSLAKEVADAITFAIQISGEMGSSSMAAPPALLATAVARLASGSGQLFELLGFVKQSTSQESRYSAAATVMTRIRVTHLSRHEAILAAYLCASIKPGTCSHIDMLDPLLGVMPAAIIWYCAFVGMMSDVPEDAFALSRAVVREATRTVDWYARPTADISHHEVRAGGSRAVKGLAQQSVALVEVAPGIVASFALRSELVSGSAEMQPGPKVMADWLRRTVEFLTGLPDAAQSSDTAAQSESDAKPRRNRRKR